MRSDALPNEMNEDIDNNTNPQDPFADVDALLALGLDEREPLRETTNSAANNRRTQTKWRTSKADLILVQEAEKAGAHVAGHKEKAAAWKKVLQEVTIRGVVNVTCHRTISARFEELMENAVDPNKKLAATSGDSAEIHKIIMQCHEERNAHKEMKNTARQKEQDLVQGGDDLRNKSAQFLFKKSVQRAGGAKLFLSDDGSIQVETTDGGAPVNLSSLLTKSPTKKKGAAELVQALLSASGQSTEAKNQVETRKLDLMMEDMKNRREEAQQKHELEMVKFQEECLLRRDEMRLKMMEMQAKIEELKKK